MRKALAILLAFSLILTVGLLAGCKKDGDKSGKQEEVSTTAAPELPAQYLENNWASVRFDQSAANLRYHTVEEKDGNWSIEFTLPMNEYGAEVSKGDYKLITLGYGGQTDIVTGEKTLGDYAYLTVRYTQDGKACAYYDCTFDAPLNVTTLTWDNQEAIEQVYGVYIRCEAKDSATLDELEMIIASLEITDAGTADVVPTDGTEEPSQTDPVTEAPTDENTYELNAYAKMTFDPDIAALQGDGSISAANESWAATVQFDSDEALYSYTESMYDSAAEDGIEIEEKQIGDYTYRFMILPSDQLQAYYTVKTELDNLYGFTFYVEGAYDASLDEFETVLATLTIDESAIPDAPDSFGAEPLG